jgi:hypothetical protein
MATYLQICQAVARECGIARGADVSPVPTSVVGQNGELNRVVNWVTDAYLEIQNSQDWRFLRKKFTLDTVDGTDAYTFSDCIDVDLAVPITRFKSFRLNDRRNPPKIFLKSTGVGSEVFLSFTSWNNFEYLYKTGSLQEQTAFPFHVTIDPKDQIFLGVTPDNIYVMTGDYHKSAQILTLDADVPEMPAAYHDLIKYRAMEWYALFESAPEILSRAERGIRRVTHQLLKNQREQFRTGGPLA